LGPHDQQHLLASPTPDERVALLSALLHDAVEVLEMRLGAPGEG
jgi:hypothetical protein